MKSKRTITAANTGAEIVLSITAVNELAADGSLLIPYGDTPVVASNGERVIQRHDKEAMERMVTAFNSLRARFMRRLKGDVPIFLGHPDMPGCEEAFPDKRARGYVEAVNIGAEGITLTNEWTNLGSELRTENKYRYPSPRWELEFTGENVNGVRVTRPVRLLSVGMTDRPNIKAVVAYNSISASNQTTIDQLRERVTAAIQNDERFKSDDGESSCSPNCCCWLRDLILPETNSTEYTAIIWDTEDQQLYKLPVFVAADMTVTLGDGEPVKVQVAYISAGNAAGGATKKEVQQMDPRLIKLLAWLGLTEAANEEQVIPAADAKLSTAVSASHAEAQAKVDAANEAKDKAVKDLADERSAWATKKQGFEDTIAAVNAKLTAANEAIRRDRKQRVTDALVVAVNTGQLTAAQKDERLAALKPETLDTLEAVNTLVDEIGQLPKTVKTEAANNATTRKAEAEVSQQRITAINEAVGEKMKQTGLPYTDAYLAVKNEKPKLFA